MIFLMKREERKDSFFSRLHINVTKKIDWPAGARGEVDYKAACTLRPLFFIKRRKSPVCIY